MIQEGFFISRYKVKRDAWDWIERGGHDRYL